MSLGGSPTGVVDDCRKSQTLDSLTGKAGGLPILIKKNVVYVPSNPVLNYPPMKASLSLSHSERQDRGALGAVDTLSFMIQIGEVPPPEEGGK